MTDFETLTPTRRAALFPLEDLHAALETRPCTGCGAPDGFIHTYSDSNSSQVFCPRCSMSMTLYGEAEGQLERLLLPVVQAWAQHWTPILSSAGVREGVSSILEGIGPEFGRIMAKALEGKPAAAES